MCFIACARTPTTKKTPSPLGGQRCSARAQPGRASHSIEICQAVSRPGLFGNPDCCTSPLAQDKQFQVVLAVWRNPCTGTFCASEGEQRISSDISQWTDRYSIASSRSWAPSASLNLLLAISTRSLPRLSSHSWSTRTMPEKVHAVPLTRKPLSCPWLSRNLSVFLGSFFS